MRFGRGVGPSELVIFDRGQEIGRIEEGAVRFTGFGTPNQAAVAAQVAARALARRRSRSAAGGAALDDLLLASHGGGQYLVDRSSLVARLIPPDPASAEADWGFEIALRAEERAPVFAMSRVRTMWHAVQGSGMAPGPSTGSEVGALAAGGI